MSKRPAAVATIAATYAYIAARRGDIVSPDELAAELGVSRHTVHLCIRSLRDVIDRNDELVTIPRRGYLLKSRVLPLVLEQ